MSNENTTLQTNQLIVNHNGGDDAPVRRRRADAVANDRLVRSTALDLFAAQGIDAVTMAGIAEVAGVGKGTLYRAFPNKGALCLALMDDDLRAFQEQVLVQLTALRDMPVLTVLDRFLEASVFFMAQHAGLMCEAEKHGSLHGRSEINQTSLHDWFKQTVMLLLQQVQQQHELEPESDIAHLADLVLAPFNPRLIAHQIQQEKRSPASISMVLRRFVHNGLRGEIAKESQTAGDKVTTRAD